MKVLTQDLEVPEQAISRGYGQYTVKDAVRETHRWMKMLWSDTGNDRKNDNKQARQTTQEGAALEQLLGASALSEKEKDDATSLAKKKKDQEASEAAKKKEKEKAEDESSDCVWFPKPPKALAGGLKVYPNAVIRSLEPLYQNLRNYWYYEQSVGLDFTPYLPVPAVLSSSTKLNEEFLQKTKRLFVIGPNKFYRATKHLVDMYSPYFAFDQVHMVDPSSEFNKTIPDKYRNLKKPQYFFNQTSTVVGTGQEKHGDLIKYLEKNVKKEDFTVFFLFCGSDINNTVFKIWGFS